MDRINITKLIQVDPMSIISMGDDCEFSFCSLLLKSARTPMSVLLHTPITAPQDSRRTLGWLYYPVASTGHVVRPLSFGADFFKLQLQYVVSLLVSLLLVSNWSCNLKELICAHLPYYRTPMTMLFRLFTSNIDTQQPTAAINIQ